MSCLMAKPTKWSVHPAKTQISLGIRPVWPESSLSAWRKLPIEHTAKTLIRLGRCSGWSESSLGAQVILLVLSWGDWNRGWRKLDFIYSRSRVKYWTPYLRFSFWVYESYRYFIERGKLSLVEANIWATSWENMFYAICEQQRRRSACASVQSDQHLCYLLLR